MHNKRPKSYVLVLVQVILTVRRYSGGTASGKQYLVPCSFFVRFVLSSCRFPFVYCIAFFAFLFAPLLPLVADSVILLFRLGATPPPALCEPEVCVFSLRAVFFLALLMFTFFFFLPFLPFFRFRFGHRLFLPIFFLWVLCCLLGFGFCCDSFSI